MKKIKTLLLAMSLCVATSDAHAMGRSILQRSIAPLMATALGGATYIWCVKMDRNQPFQELQHSNDRGTLDVPMSQFSKSSQPKIITTYTAKNKVLDTVDLTTLSEQALHAKLIKRNDSIGFLHAWNSMNIPFLHWHGAELSLTEEFAGNVLQVAASKGYMTIIDSFLTFEISYRKTPSHAVFIKALECAIKGETALGRGDEMGDFTTHDDLEALSKEKHLAVVKKLTVIVRDENFFNRITDHREHDKTDGRSKTAVSWSVNDKGDISPGVVSIPGAEYRTPWELRDPKINNRHLKNAIDLAKESGEKEIYDYLLELAPELVKS